MSFKYTVSSDTMSWVGYNVLETPGEVFQAVKDAGYDGIDLPGDPKRTVGSEWRKRAGDVGLEVPEVLGAWGYARRSPPSRNCPIRRTRSPNCANISKTRFARSANMPRGVESQSCWNR